MKRGLLTIILLTGCLLFVQFGCDKEAQVDSGHKAKPKATKTTVAEKQPETKMPAEGTGAKIEFEKQVRDFGQIGPSTRNLWEFKFKNAGSDVLKITKISKTCGCTPFTLEKKEYAPGESGKITGKYYSGRWPGITNKHLFVYTNDQSNPKVELTIKANIVLKVAAEPKKLNLLLKKENASCPKITIKSLDGKPFSIRYIQSTGDCITADIDRSAKAAEFVIEPKVNVEKLKSRMTGRVDINLDQPECKVVSIPFTTLTRFMTEPRIITVLNVEPQKPITRKLWLLNNYNEDFQVESASSEKGVIKVLNQEKVGSRYKFELEITPPKQQGKMRVFNDVLTVKVKDEQDIQVRCVGSYARLEKQ
ncbi:MAG: DUF1573 domain-containing protein [Sedimentisphaerales bacterium]|nr:DUF1573 domain-containing protein [Sedimentisphaerales bacterium]